MKKQVLFIQGGGDNGYKADRPLVNSLEKALGKDYKVSYPELKDEGGSDFGWLRQIGKEIDNIKGEVILAGHSFGASMILKYLSESKVKKKISAIFLLSTPFWSGNEDWKAGLKLKPDFADNIPGNIPISLYHTKDDEEVPFEHLSVYAKKLTRAKVHEIKSGGHSYNNDLSFLAKDMERLGVEL